MKTKLLLIGIGLVISSALIGAVLHGTHGVIGDYDRSNDVVSWYVDSNYNIVPGKTNTYDLGTSALQVKKAYLKSLDVGDGNITNVGDISLDSISSNGSVVAIEDNATIGGDKAVVSSETNQQNIQQGTVDITVSGNTGTAIIDYVDYNSAPVVVASIGEEVALGDTMILDVDAAYSDTAVIRLVGTDGIWTVNWIAVGDDK